MVLALGQQDAVKIPENNLISSKRQNSSLNN